MKSLFNSNLGLFGSSFNLAMKLFPKPAFHFSLRLISILSQRKLKPEDRVLYAQGFEMNVTVDNQVIKGHIWGEGPVIVLVHGWRSNAASWKHYIPHLLESGYQVVALDAPGHGINQPMPFDLGIYFNAVQKLINQIDNIHAVVGHSIGATAAFFGCLPIINKPNCLILLSPYGSVMQLAEEMADLLKLSPAFIKAFDQHMFQHTGRDLHNLDISKHVHRLNHSIIDIIHSQDDPVSPIKFSYNIQSKATHVLLHQMHQTGHRKSEKQIVNKVLQIIRDQRQQSRWRVSS